MYPETKIANRQRRDGILQWFASAATSFGERTAIEWRDRRISYSCLTRIVNQRANRLIANGITKDSIVAVMLDDRVEMIATLLSIFKAGAVFVPLDPTYPVDRLSRIVTELQPDAFIIEDSHSNKVETISQYCAKSCKLMTAGIIPSDRRFGEFLNPVHEGPDSFSDEEPDIDVDPDSMRYIYYTSGSTGDPKGIAGRLSGLSHFVRWEIDTLKIDSTWRVSQFTTPTFDAYFRDVLVPLCSGSMIVVPPEPPVMLGSDAAIDWIDRNQINLIHCVPSVLRAILSGDVPGEKFRSLRYVLLSGEILQVADVKRWMEIAPSHSKLVNLYGATETTMVKFFHFVEAGDVARGFIPIGKPMKGAKAIVLDERMRPCPPGIAGEIYVRTPFRTLGYYKQPERTKQVFLKNPFNDDPQDLIYRTGDLGVLLNDGNFRFLGRKDHLLKIRGIRVELGDVENNLLSHPLVTAAVAVAHQRASGEARLVAYVVAQGITVGELRDFMKRKVPEYMVPSDFVLLKELPLTPTGKVDRKALPDPDRNFSEVETNYIPPRDAVEAQLTKIWETVLQRGSIGGQDDFFDLGGHSLLAVQVVHRIKEVFGRTISVKALFQAPTVEKLAQVLREDDPLRDWASLQPLQPNGSKPPFFFLAGRSHFGDRLGPDQPVYRVIYQDLDREQPFVRIEDMAAHSIKSIKKIQPTGPYFLGGHAVGGVVAFEMAQQLRREGQKVALLALCECWAPQSRPPVSSTSATQQLWQKAGYHFRRARRSGMKQALSDVLRSLKKKSHRFVGSSQPVPLTPEEKEARAAVLKARACYVPQVYSGRIVLLRCSEPAAWRERDPLDGWGNLAADGVEMYEIRGGHASIYREPYVGALAKTLRDVLRKAQADIENEGIPLVESNAYSPGSRTLDTSQGSATTT